MSLSQETINEQLALLATHRRTLAHLVQQAAEYGGEVFAPPQTASGIIKARSEIQRIKDILRPEGVTITDEPNDASLSSEHKRDASSEPTISEPLKIFLCHSKIDKLNVRNLYQRLRADGFQPWLDEEELIGGQDWDAEIAQAVRESDVVLVCLSQNASNRTGYIHREIKYALDIADQQPKGTIFIIPLRLEECEVPQRLRRWHWINLYEEKGYTRLIQALRHRATAKQNTSTFSKETTIVEPLSTSLSSSSLSTVASPNTRKVNILGLFRGNDSKISFALRGMITILIVFYVYFIWNSVAYPSSQSLFPTGEPVPSLQPTLTPSITPSATSTIQITVIIATATPSFTINSGRILADEVVVYRNLVRRINEQVSTLNRGTTIIICDYNSTERSFKIAYASCTTPIGWINQNFVEILIPTRTK